MTPVLRLMTSEHDSGALASAASRGRMSLQTTYEAPPCAGGEVGIVVQVPILFGHPAHHRATGPTCW